MGIELPYNMEGEYWRTEDGVALTEFATKLHLPKYAEVFPLSIGRAANFLGFSNTNTGIEAIRKTALSGLITCDSTFLSRPVIIVLQKIKDHVVLKEKYANTHQRLLDHLTGSGLENYIGKFNPNFSNQRVRLPIADLDYHRYVEWRELNKPRANVF